MRLVPRRWSNETWICSVRGHVAPAAVVRHLRPQDDALGVEAPDGSRLSRCLRCDLWLHTTAPAAVGSPGAVADADAPEVLPPTEELPRPRRGRALEDAILTRLIAVERALHSALFVAAAMVLFVIEIDLGGVRTTAGDLSDGLQGAIANSGRGGSHAWLTDHLRDVGAWRLDTIRLLLIVAVAYSVLEGVEAWGLWRERRWAEYLTVVATIGFLPFEVHELTTRVTVLRLLALVVNLAVLVWLVWDKRLFGLRGGRSAAPFDTDWDAVLRAAPCDASEIRC